jgi:hypothetical protein
LLPHPKLKPVYNKIVWLWACWTHKKDAADLEAERIHVRFGVSCWPQSFLLNPATIEILAHTGRDVDSFLNAVNKSADKISPPEKQAAELTGRLESAKKKLALGKTAEAKEILLPLSKEHDQWEIGLEAQEILETINQPAVNKPVLQWLESPNPNRRAMILEDLATKKSNPKPPATAARLLEDKDGLVRTRAIQYFAKADPAALEKIALKLLSDPLDYIKYEMLTAVKNSGDPKMPDVLEEFVGKIQKNEVVMGNPNVVKMRTCDVLAEIGKPSAIQLLSQWITPYEPANLSAIQTVGKIGKRGGLPGIQLAFPVLIKSFPEAKESGDAKQQKVSLNYARVVHNTLVELSDNKVNFPGKWGADERYNLITSWKQWYNNLPK